MAFVIAIDFGTTYSGYAYNITPKGKQSDPQLKRWGKEVGLDTPKTPTCILFNENEEFMKFGYEAKNAYINMKGEEAKKHYFFENFKMDLYGKKLSRNMMTKAANGKEMKALKVFTESLRFLKDDALKTINVNSSNTSFTASDFTWVLTVPAIWDQAAKQLMRRAAAEAGIVTEVTAKNLIIALEPEAASVWCKTLPADGFLTQNNNRSALDQNPGTHYTVVDCGGGTIDITVHEVLRGGALKELYTATGNNLGGQTVDRKFKEFLREIFSDIWNEYEQNCPSEVQKIMHEFMIIKQVDEDIQISCPFKLGMLAQEVKDIEKFFESVEGASWNDGFTKISKDKLRSFYADSLQGITEKLREILRQGFKIDYILLVGGYANSQILRQHVTDQFGKRCNVLCPSRPEEAVMRGAVEFGMNPEVVVSRKSSYTYGFAVCEKFDELKHEKEKKYTVNGTDWSRDVFKKLVEEGEDVQFDETREFLCSPAKPGQVQMKLRFYRSLKKTPVHIDEWGVEKSGSFYVGIRNSTKNKKHKVKLDIKFGSTEITATGTNLVTGEKKEINIDFMTEDDECMIDDGNEENECTQAEP